MRNMLLWCLAESRHLGDHPEVALTKVMMMIAGHPKHPLLPAACALWEERYGEPTLEKLEEWVAQYAADPENTATMARLRKEHEAVMATFTDEEKAELATYMPRE